jgi:hypothetical protein
MIPNTETNGLFHLREGFYFRRNEDGTVTIMYRQPMHPDSGGATQYPHLTAEITVPATEFASVMATVSARGETYETWQEAVSYLDTNTTPSLEDRLESVLADLKKIGSSNQELRGAEDYVSFALELLRKYVMGIVL